MTHRRPKDIYDLLRRMRGEDLTSKEFHVLMMQYSYADKDGRGSYVSERTLAEDLGMSVSSLREHRRVLRDEKGWLVRLHRGINLGNGGSRASTYEIVIPTTAESSALVQPPEIPENRRSQPPKTRPLPTQPTIDAKTSNRSRKEVPRERANARGKQPYENPWGPPLPSNLPQENPM